MSKSCKDSYSWLFNDMCKQCPNCLTSEQAEAGDQVIQDIKNCYCSVRYKVIEWTDGKPVVVKFLQDIDEEYRAREKLYSLAYIDQLTGIPNRRKLKEDFDAVEEQIIEAKVAGALAIFDLDNFKTINDSYGHGTGDTMLKRLTSYLESETAFTGHLYRLGGDEFVLLYTEPMERFQSIAECKSHFGEIFKGALRSYSLPNITSTCTLSMGVSFFPWQGQGFSELLRKADIALYKAKADGRNQISLFEESFDTAQTFKDIYINVQPILTAEGKTYGYELVDQSNVAEENDDSLNLSDFDRTMEALGLDDLESSTMYFITYSNQLLNHAVAKHLPINKFIIEIRLPEEVNEKLLGKYAELHGLGYSLWFSRINKRNAKPEMFRFAKYCSFDSRETDENYKKQMIFYNSSVVFIAMDVDTLTQFETANKLGYKLFQGHFFKRQRIVKKTKEINQLKVNYLRLLKLTSAEGFIDFREISDIISSDVALSYKLLRLLNSAAVGLRKPVSSISLAVSYLGEENLKKWIAMLALRGVADDKPQELVRLSLIRARFGELMCKHMKPPRDSKKVFLLGMLSLLDVALDKSKEEVFKDISVASEIRESLLTESGPYSDLIKFFSDYEHARWGEVGAFTRKNRLLDTQVNSAFVESVKWYNAMASFE
jgi:EAL and modified HD-GYP domain-containing signal transduction protein